MTPVSNAPDDHPDRGHGDGAVADRPDDARDHDDAEVPDVPTVFNADPDDPELNPEVERASEIDDVTGPVTVITDQTPPEGGGGPGEPGDAAEAGGRRDGAATAGEPDGVVDDDELAVLCAERDQYKEMAQRIQAEFENFRKRSVAQASAEADRAAGRLVEALLPALDAAEAAYIGHPDEVGPLLNALLGELRKQGLETIELEGKPFDPEVAEAVAHEPGDGGDVVVAEVLRSGYRWRGKTLRAAMVRTRD